MIIALLEIWQQNGVLCHLHPISTVVQLLQQQTPTKRRRRRSYVKMTIDARATPRSSSRTQNSKVKFAILNIISTSKICPHHQFSFESMAYPNVIKNSDPSSQIRCLVCSVNCKSQTCPLLTVATNATCCSPFPNS